MLRLERISKIFPTGEVLRDITWEIKQGDRIGLVGVNGSGKSTQMQIIAGLQEATDGLVIKEGEPIIAYLKQEFDVDITKTVREELFHAFGDAADVLNQQKIIENEMGSIRASQDSGYLDDLIKKLGILQGKWEAINGYELEASIDKILPTIGFEKQQADSLVGDFSGGWQMRIALGKILLQKPDLLLLDEPTNHLDLDAISWLEDYLCQQKIAIVIISHDRQFLDKVCNQIVLTENGISRTYTGNYSSYIEQVKIDNELRQSAFQRQQKEIETQQSYINRFRASATRSTQAKSREKMLDKVERIKAPITTNYKPTFKFNSASRSGQEIVSINKLTHSYGENILFLEAELLLERGDRVALIGPNGCGKSTLLRLIMGIESPDEGIVEIGSHNIIPGYFAQNQAETLDLNRTVIDTLFDAVPDWTQTQIRSLLGGLGLRDESVFKLVGQISGGEKARLAMALLITQPCNLLVLDEPTNHLDIPSKQMLEEAIADYDGSLIVISHDRYFISKIANRIVEISDGQLVLYRGNYTYYKEKKKEELIASQKQLLLAEQESKRLAKRSNQRKRHKKNK